MDFQDEKYSVYSLSKLAEELRFAIYRTFPDQFWVQAEIAKMNIYPRSGHVYLDLVEKQNGTTQAQMRGIIWANDFPEISRKFELVTREPFREGLKVLFLARCNFHASFGFSLWISDLEPSFTLGELSRLKNLAIKQLHQDKIFDLNRQLPIPALPLRIAVISAETSKGYLDFLQVIHHHAVSYQFEITLFPALLQGDKAVESIREQLNEIKSSTFKVQGSKDQGQSDRFKGRGKVEDCGLRAEDCPRPTASCQLPTGFDLVAIIRGGGDEIGMTCFDNYELARDVCTFPLPVVTGIGHSTNETVVEMVAALNRITPTEVAYDLISRLDAVYDRLMDTETKLSILFTGLLSGKKERLYRISEILQSTTIDFVRRHHRDLGHQRKTLLIHLNHLFSLQKSTLSGAEDQIRQLDPKKILQRGYSLTYDEQGRIVKDASLVKAGDKIQTELAKGIIKSTVDL